MIDTPPPLHGADCIRQMADLLPQGPGVYRMLNADKDVLYVGKARALKRRVLSYTQSGRLNARLRRMVAETRAVEIIHTETEVEALLLEATLIKTLAPRYNILLRDDKSFPYIHISTDHDAPAMRVTRGPQAHKGRSFGPYANAHNVYKTLIDLQRAFLLRNCADSDFATRKRPCLQYHIKRCTAPCVGYVSPEEYRAQVDETCAFLSGQSSALQEKLRTQMEAASTAMDFETAALLRDRLRTMASIQSQHALLSHNLADGDVMAMARQGTRSCISVYVIRDSKSYGQTHFFPQHGGDDTDADIMQAFVAQFYATRLCPPVILLNVMPLQPNLLANALSQQGGKRVTLHRPQRGSQARLLDSVAANAAQALERKLRQTETEVALLTGLTELLHLPAPPQRIEVYDNSHTAGQHMIGAMIVAGPEGFQKKAYRTFNIRHAGKSDDLAMMREVLTRRLHRLTEEKSPGDPDWPDLLLIDGGPTQLAVAQEVLAAANLDGQVHLAGISKGPQRNAGLEYIHVPGHSPVQPKHNDPVLHYLQRLRDEAHRFAIGTHRRKRQAQHENSPLDGFSGIGPTRKKSLLMHFGSARAVTRASVADLVRAPGISQKLAESIYAHFHDI
ncbi:MAG: excinuclease ABC subunit UvrC [Pseudomonadota bacterium]